MRYPGRSVRGALAVPRRPGLHKDSEAIRSGGGHGAADRGAGVTVLLAAVWLLLDYPWGLLAFVAIAALFGGRGVQPLHWPDLEARAEIEAACYHER